MIREATRRVVEEKVIDNQGILLQSALLKVCSRLFRVENETLTSFSPLCCCNQSSDISRKETSKFYTTRNSSVVM